MRPDRLSHPVVSALLDRVSGAPLRHGHDLQLLQDSDDHEAATLALLATARQQVLIENYCLEDDDWGRTLIAALVACAARGVSVHVITDWLGSRGRPPERLATPLRRAGGQWRCWNPLSLRDPLAVFGRNHRKLLVVDSREAMVTGWCHSTRWRGQPGGKPWRDTGIVLRGEAAPAAAGAFRSSWAACGGRPDDIRLDTMPAHDPLALPWHDVSLRLLAGQPGGNTLFRSDQLAINLAQRRLWLTDAYPVGAPAHLDSLRRAARDGIDVRLLVPGSSDLPVVGMLARTSYRNLLDAGVRIFEWRGSMLHAKTAIMDDGWTRIGSSNLNPASWLGNREMDVLIEDTRVADAMAKQYLQDLDHAVEIVCDTRRRVRPGQPPGRDRRRQSRPLLSPAPLRLTRAMADAMRESRPLDATDAALLAGSGGFILLGVAAACWLPVLAMLLVAIPGGLLGIALLRLAWQRYRQHRRESGPLTP